MCLNQTCHSAVISKLIYSDLSPLVFPGPVDWVKAGLFAWNLSSDFAQRLLVSPDTLLSAALWAGADFGLPLLCLQQRPLLLQPCQRRRRALFWGLRQALLHQLPPLPGRTAPHLSAIWWLQSKHLLFNTSLSSRIFLFQPNPFGSSHSSLRPGWGYQPRKCHQWGCGEPPAHPHSEQHQQCWVRRSPRWRVPSSFKVSTTSFCEPSWLNQLIKTRFHRSFSQHGGP